MVAFIFLCGIWALFVEIILMNETLKYNSRRSGLVLAIYAPIFLFIGFHLPNTLHAFGG